METNIDRKAIRDGLDTSGFAVIPSLLSAEECSGLIDIYGIDKLFRSTISMERYHFGKGEALAAGYRACKKCMLNQ